MPKPLEVAAIADAIGLYCPFPLVKLRIALKMVNVNEIVELVADDPGVLEDIPAWCKETGNTLLSIEKNEEDIFVVYVKKIKE